MKDFKGAPTISTPKGMFAGDMWVVFNFANPNTRYQRFLQNGGPRFAHFLDGLLLYEHVVIPTQDFMSLTVLVGVLGEHAVIDLLEARDLRFVRLRGAFSYVGNGVGLKSFEMLHKEDRMVACFASESDAISWALDGLNPPSKDPALRKLALSNTTTVEMSQIESQVRHETYMDVLNSSHLRTSFGIRNTDLDHLAGIQPTGVRCYGGPDSDSKTGDEIDTLLDLCSANVELRLLDLAGCDDASAANPIGHLLKAKADRTLGGTTPFESLVSLLELEGIPDITRAVLDKPVSERCPTLSGIMKIKRSRDGTAFRHWFHAHCRDNPREVAKQYVELLKQEPTITKLPSRIVRFLVTSTAGIVVGPIVGTAASAVDSFVIDRLLRGASPKFFIQDIKQILGRKK